MTSKTEFGIADLSDPSVRKVLQFLVEHRRLDYSKEQIARHAGISRPTLYRIWPSLEKNGLIKETRKYGNSQLYKLNERNEVIKKLVELEMSIVRENFKQMEMLNKGQSLEKIAELLQKVKASEDVPIDELKDALQDVKITAKDSKVKIIEIKKR